MCRWRLHRATFLETAELYKYGYETNVRHSGLIMSGCNCSKSLVTVTTCTQMVTFFVTRHHHAEATFYNV